MSVNQAMINALRGWLKEIMPNLPAAKRQEYAPHLFAAMVEFEITNERRVAAFLAQLAHESLELKLWVENLNYSADRLLKVFPKYFKSRAAAERVAQNPEAIANIVYQGRLGNEKIGDGWRYRGRSPIQLTGRSNYREVGNAINVNLEDNPDLAATPDVGFRIAGYFWHSRGLNPLADQRKFRAITKLINGGLHGYADRVRYYERALRVIPDNIDFVMGVEIAADEHDSDVHDVDVEVIEAHSDERVEPYLILTSAVEPPRDPVNFEIVDDPQRTPGIAEQAPTTIVEHAERVVVPPSIVPGGGKDDIPVGAQIIERVKPALRNRVVAALLPAGGIGTLWAAILWLKENPIVLAAIILFCAVSVLSGVWLWNKAADRAHELTKYKIRNREDGTKINVAFTDEKAP